MQVYALVIITKNLTRMNKIAGQSDLALTGRTGAAI